MHPDPRHAMPLFTHSIVGGALDADPIRLAPRAAGSERRALRSAWHAFRVFRRPVEAPAPAARTIEPVCTPAAQPNLQGCR